MNESINAVERPVWGAWATAGLGLGVFAAYFVAQAIVGVIMVVMEMISNPDANPTELEELLPMGLLLALAILASTPVGVGAILIVIKLKNNATITSYLALTHLRGRTYLLLFVLTLVLVAIAEFVSQFVDQSETSEFMINIYETMVWPTGFWIAIVLGAPLFEEAFFRGFLLEGFRRCWMGTTGAVILTSLLWASIHIQYDLNQIAQIFFFGVVLGVVRIKTGSLWSVLFMHAVWNLVATVLTSLYVNGVIE